jgi:fucose permease
MTGAAILGLAGPFGVIMTQAEVMDRHRAHLATANAELSLVVSMAMLVTTLGVGPLVAITDSWRLALLLPVAVFVSGAPLALSLHFTDRQRTKRVPQKQAMSPLAWLFCVLCASQSAFEWCYGYLGAEFMNKVGGLGKEAAATSMALYYGGLVVGRILLVPAVRKFTSFQLLLGSFIVAIAGFLIMAGGPIVQVKLLGLLVSGLGISVAFPMIANLAAVSFPDATAWIIGRIYVAGGLAVGVAPFAIGALGDRIGIARSFWVLGAIALIGLLATTFLNRFLAAHQGHPSSETIARQSAI